MDLKQIWNKQTFLSIQSAIGKGKFNKFIYLLHGKCFQLKKCISSLKEYPKITAKHFHFMFRVGRKIILDQIITTTEGVPERQK